MPSSWHAVRLTEGGRPSGKGDLCVEEDRRGHDLTKPCRVDMICDCWKDKLSLAQVSET